MTNAWLDEGLRSLAAGDWSEAINNLRWAGDAEPQNPSIHLALIDAYERAAASEGDPDLLQQAWNACRALRDRNLPLTEEQRAAFRATFVRVRDAIVSARGSGWTPPPSKEEVHRT
jgi:hypothetical protein